MSAFNAILDAYSEEKKGKKSFVSLTYEEAAKLGHNGGKLAKTILHYALHSGLGGVLITSASLATDFVFNTNFSSGFFLKALFGVVVGTSVVGVLNQRSEMRKASQHMLDMGQRPVAEVEGLLPAIPEEEQKKRLAVSPTPKP